MEGFEPNKCPFLVDIVVNNIGLKAFVKDRRARKKQKRNVAMRTLEHIDVHVKATIRNMNASCSDVTQSTVTGDLLGYDKFILKFARYAQVAAGLSFVQLLFVYCQIQYSTPANIASKQSLFSVGMLSVLDAYLCMIHLSTALYITDLFYSFAMVFFLKFLAFSVFDLRLIILVWRGRHPLDFSSGWLRVRRTLSKIYFGFFGGIFVSLLLLNFVRKNMNNVVFLLFSF